MKPKIPPQTLHEILDYDPVVGRFKWRPRQPRHFSASQGRSPNHKCENWNSRYAGRHAGYIDGFGYLSFSIFGTVYRAHRVAWAMMTGAWPPDQIDHRDGNTTVCVWANLRLVTHQQNRCNNKLYQNNTSGHTGVAWNPGKKKWRARIRKGNRDRHIGYFATKDAAIEARRREEEVLFGQFSRLSAP